MAHRSDEANELAFIGGELGMLRGHRATEEGDGTLALVKNGVETRSGHVAIHNKRRSEIRKLQDWRCCERALEVMERCCRGVTPVERIALEGRQGCGDHAVIVDETAIISGEAEKSVQRLERAWKRPLLNSLNLVIVHGHNPSFDDMAKIVDAPLNKSALRTLEEQAVLAQRGEDSLNMIQMF